MDRGGADTGNAEKRNFTGAESLGVALELFVSLAELLTLDRMCCERYE